MPCSRDDLAQLDDGELARRHEAMIRSYALGYVEDLEMAKDLTQEAFIKAYTNLRMLKNPSKFKSWIRRIAHRLCIDWLRSPMRREISFAEILNQDNYGNESVLFLADSSPSVEEIIEKKERKRVMLQALGSLSPEYRSVVFLRYWEDKSYEEIQAYLKVPLSTVKWRLYKAIVSLRKKMNRQIIE